MGKKKILKYFYFYLIIFLLILSFNKIFFANENGQSSVKLYNINERIDCLKTIEKIYWQNRIWPQWNNDSKPAFDDIIAEDMLKEKALDTMKKITALNYFWNKKINGEELQLEIEHIANNTKRSDILENIFNALNYDAEKIAYCIALPKLVNKILKKNYLNTININVLKENYDLEEQFQLWWNEQKKFFEPTLQVPNYNFTLPDIKNNLCQEDSWKSVSLVNAPDARKAHTAIWTGAEMIIWGGYNQSTYYKSGYKYDPILDDWESISITNAPSDRAYHTAVWTGTEMIIWGGSYASNALNTGGRYNPVSDTWLNTTTSNAPVGRKEHTAIWTGTEMIIWGGYSNYYLNTGAKYNPQTNSWQAITQTNAPSIRSQHTAIWTGTEMIIWGGFDGTYKNTGAKYNPLNNTWTATSNTSAPSARTYHSAVWTGNHMIIWGGWNGSVALNNGKIYNPISNTWSDISNINAPEARYQHTATWTESEMIIWGGRDITSVYNNGAKYTPPPSNSWANISIINAPGERYQHSAVWTGAEMIIWGGSNFSYELNTGGKYCVNYCSEPLFDGIKQVYDIDACIKNGIKIEWEIPTSWGQGATSGTYTIRRYTNANCSGSYTTIATALSANTTSYNDTTASQGTIYYYQVIAENNCQPPLNSPGSNSCSDQVADNTASAPTGLTNNNAADLDVCNDTGVRITWVSDPVNWGDNGSGTRTYAILRNGSTIASNLAYGTTYYIDNTGINGTTYTYKVSYINGCSLSSSTSGTQASDIIGSIPSGLTNNTAIDVDECEDTGVKISWITDPSNWGDNGSGNRTYDVLRNNIAIATGLLYGTINYIDTTGNNGTVYTYSVKYNNGCSLSATTTGSQAFDQVALDPIVDTNNTATDIDECEDTGVLITWDKDPTNWGDNNQGQRTYRVLRNGLQISYELPYGTTSFIDTTGVNGITYEYSIKYINGCDKSSKTCGIKAHDYICGLISNKPLIIDPSNNGIIEEDETVILQGNLQNTSNNQATSVFGTLTTNSYGIIINNPNATYPNIDPNDNQNCINCYSLTAPSANRYWTHWDFEVIEQPTCTDCQPTSYNFTYHVGNSFNDVPTTNIFYSYIEKLLHHNIASGCTSVLYCPLANVQRQQMAKFICLAMEAVNCGNCKTSSCQQIFADVSTNNIFCPYIESLYNSGIISGCNFNPLQYCPNSNTQRQAMTKFICKAIDTINPGSCLPTNCTGIFNDVNSNNPFCPYIEALYLNGIISGCAPSFFCPTNFVSREQMAKFIINGFELTF